MREGILLVGGGGHAVSIIDTLKSYKAYEMIGILDKEEKVGQTINGVPIIGTDEEMAAYREKGVKYVFMTVGSVGLPTLRIKLVQKILDLGYTIPNIIDPKAVISESAVIGKGNYIGKGVIINAKAQIGNYNIINTGSIIEHESHIENFVHIAPGSTLCGEVGIGEQTHIGAGAVVIQGVKIGSKALIGAGSVVVEDIASGMKAYGNPCKEVGLNG